MKRADVLHTLLAQKDELHDRFGVNSLWLFGSVARDEATDVSDIDVLVEFDRPTGYFGLIALQEHLESLFQCKVDVGTARSLKPRLRTRVLGECIHVA
jgi:uncharacterized protein